MIARLRDEKGVTLLEVLATAIIVATALISIYTGIIYADKQVQRNYHDRVATLHASGELEWQKYYKKNYKFYDAFNHKIVILDKMDRGRTLTGDMSFKVTPAMENPFGTAVNYDIVEVTVKWTEPGDKTVRRIVVREDFY